MTTTQTIQSNLARVRERIADAAERSGRSSDDVSLVAVTKYAEMEWVEALLELGETNLGESRPQQLVERAAQLEGVNWHLIGHLQRNKVRPVLPLTDLIHSVDSVKLLDRINRIAEELSVTPRLLLEVNISGEEAKDGFSREELLASAEQLSEFQHVAIEGFMTMAPFSESAESTRPHFTGLRELAEQVRSRAGGAHRLAELSMGMSRDFAVAVEEGATIVRVGSTLFEGLNRD